MLQSFTLFCNVLQCFTFCTSSSHGARHRTTVQSANLWGCEWLCSGGSCRSSEGPGARELCCRCRCYTGFRNDWVMHNWNYCRWTCWMPHGQCLQLRSWVTSLHFKNTTKLLYISTNYIMSYVTLENGRMILFDMFFMWVFFFSIASWMSNMFDMFKFNSKPYWDRLRGWREMPRRVYRWCPCRCHLHYWSWMMCCQKTATPLFDPQNTVPSAPFVRHLCAICVITCHHLTEFASV